MPRTAVLVQLDRASDPAVTTSLQRAGGTLIEHELRIWALPAATARRLLPASCAAGSRGGSRPTGRCRRCRAARAQAVLPGSQWWLETIGAATLTPPGPGVPVTVVDTGIDVYHPEFAGRPNTILLNPQTGTDVPDDFHGTAVSSLIGAPGVGMLGIYPAVVLREWDASPGGHLMLSRIIAGIDAAVRAGPSVINLSLGGPVDDPLLRQAVLDAVRHGSLVVAAQGEDRFGGSPQTFPADEPHVLTVVATDREGTVYVDTNGSDSNDLSAPGVQVEVAVPGTGSPSGYKTVIGTSYAAALVSGAAAWIWTERPALDPSQLFQLLVRSARPLARAYNSVNGYGELDLRAALTAPAPPADPFEPNDDVDMVRADGLFEAATPSLTNRLRATAFIRGSLAQHADPRDVFRDLDPAPWKRGRDGHAAPGGAVAAGLARRHPQRARARRAAATRSAGGRAGQGHPAAARREPQRARHVRLPRGLDRHRAELELRARAVDALGAVGGRYSLAAGGGALPAAPASIAVATPSSSSTRRTGAPRKRRRSDATISRTAITSSEKIVVAVPSA